MGKVPDFGSFPDSLPQPGSLSRAYGSSVSPEKLQKCCQALKLCSREEQLDLAVFLQIACCEAFEAGFGHREDIYTPMEQACSSVLESLYHSPSEGYLSTLNELSCRCIRAKALRLYRALASLSMDLLEVMTDAHKQWSAPGIDGEYLFTTIIRRDSHAALSRGNPKWSEGRGRELLPVSRRLTHRGAQGNCYALFADLGDVCLEAGSRDEAAQWYQAAYNSFPDAEGEDYVNLYGNREEARIHLQRTLSLLDHLIGIGLSQYTPQRDRVQASLMDLMR